MGKTKRKSEKRWHHTHLNTTRGHFKLRSQCFPEGGVGLGLAFECFFEDLELLACCTLAMFYFGRIVRIKCAKINGGRVDAGG